MSLKECKKMNQIVLYWKNYEIFFKQFLAKICFFLNYFQFWIEPNSNQFLFGKQLTSQIKLNHARKPKNVGTQNKRSLSANEIKWKQHKPGRMNEKNRQNENCNQSNLTLKFLKIKTASENWQTK